MTYAIETQRLTRMLGGRRVLSDVSLRVAVGECVAIHGENGAGKTTLLRCLANLWRPTSGCVSWFGEIVAPSRSRQSLVGFLSHESNLYLELTARENLLLAARLHSLADPRARVDQWLQRIALRGGHDAPVRGCSEGMRRRVSLARALLHEPPLVLLDEPFSALDQQGQQWLSEQFHEWRRERRTVCFTGHDPQLSAEFADRTLWIHSGRCQERATVEC